MDEQERDDFNEQEIAISGNIFSGGPEVLFQRNELLRNIMSEPKKAPINTTTHDEKYSLLLESMMLSMDGKSPSDAILNQESRGQDSFVTSETLPEKLGSSGERILTQAGVIFGEGVPGDPLFRYVQLPTGWTKQATDHSMWSDLIDDKGRIRASIFYKAAFYDRDAFLRLRTRYTYRQNYDLKDAIQFQVYDQSLDDRGTILFSTPTVPKSKDWKEYSAKSDELSLLALGWLTEHYPDWRDEGAYWD